LELLHIERARVDVEILENSSRGMLGFGGKPARIRATVRSPLGAALDENATTADVPRETPSPSASSTEAAVETARGALAEVLQALAVQPPSSAQVADDGSWRFVLEGDGAGIVIGRHGQTLDALEYLMSRIASHAAGHPVRIALDVENYRERRQESLEQTARRAAEKARAAGRTGKIRQHSPDDMRLASVT